MNHQILEIIPVRLGNGLIDRLSYMLEITEPETGLVNSGLGTVDIEDADVPEAEWPSLILASREYGVLAAQVASALLEALTMHRRAAFAPAPIIPPTEAQSRAIWVQQIDTNIANIITKRTQFQMGYEKREAAALAYKNAGYKGDPTGMGNGVRPGGWIHGAAGDGHYSRPGKRLAGWPRSP
jgi:hypothetical protein